MTASHGSAASMSHQAAAGGKKSGRFIRGSSDGVRGGAHADGSRPYSSASDLAGILNAGSSGDAYHHRRPFGSAGVGGLGGLEYLEGDGGLDGLDDSSVSAVSSNFSVDDSGSAVCRGDSETAAEARGGGGAEGGDGSPCPTRGVVAVAAGAASARRARRSGFRESSGDAGGDKKVTVRKMAREVEGLKLTCAEMERSQMRTEQQMQSFATG